MRRSKTLKLWIRNVTVECAVELSAISEAIDASLNALFLLQIEEGWI